MNEIEQGNKIEALKEQIIKTRKGKFYVPNSWSLKLNQLICLFCFLFIVESLSCLSLHLFSVYGSMVDSGLHLSQVDAMSSRNSGN